MNDEGELNNQMQNTAQPYLLSLLDELNADHTNELRLAISLQGELDFSVLHDRHFKHITHIYIKVAGQITNLINIPEGVTYVECQNNYIENIKSEGQFPTSMEYLNLTGNSLHSLSANSMPNLKTLLVPFNRLEIISDLPEMLETLDCRNNRLVRLNLTDMHNLKKLHCSNNTLLVIHNLPDTLTDYENENNPLVDIEFAKVREPCSFCH